MSANSNWIYFRRFVASLIDYALLLFLIFAYITFFGNYVVDAEGNERWIVFGLRHYLVFFIAWLVWIPIVESIFGFTLGKGLLDLYVQFEDGKKVTFGSVFARHAFDPLDFLLIILFGFGAIVKPNRMKRIGEWMTDTRVVHIPENTSSVKSNTTASTVIENEKVANGS